MIRYENAIKKRLENIGNRSLVLIGDDYFADYVSDDLDKMNIHVDYRLKCRNERLQYFGEPRKEIQLNREKEFILIAVYNKHKEYVECIEKLGFVYQIDFEVMGMGGYCVPLTRVSPLLTYCREEEYEKIGNGSYVISIYGDSTTDIGRGGSLSWPNFLWESLNNRGINTTIYNGAVSGYNSAQEFLKLCRDIQVIKLKLVISFSGIRDIANIGIVEGYPFSNGYQRRMWENICAIPGTIPDSMDMRKIEKYSMGEIRKERVSDSELWIEHEKMMYVICNLFNVQFIGVVEPMIYAGVYNGRIEQELLDLLYHGGIRNDYFEAQSSFADEIGKLNLDFLIDESDMLRNETYVFLDNAHYTEKGKKIIGKKLAELIVESSIL